ncbi:MAG TPA: hypothetical protein VF077_09385 [Nitrospiraceae bacterium]
METPELNPTLAVPVVESTQAKIPSPVKDSVPLTENQQQRVAYFKESLVQVGKDMDEIKKREVALRMGIESVLATILECNGKSVNDRFMLAEDGKSLVPARREGVNGVAL